MSLPKPYYETELGKLYLGDCLTMLPHLEPVDLVLTDPPYGTEELGGGYGRRQNYDPEGRFGRRIIGDNDLSTFQGFINTVKIHKPGAIVSFCAARKMDEVYEMFKKRELMFFGELIWDKGTPGLGYTIRYSHESAFVFVNGEIVTPLKALNSVVRSQVSHNNNHKK